MNLDHSPEIERPAQSRKVVETDRVLRILDDIADDRPPLAVEMLVTRDGRRERNEDRRES